MDKATVEDYRRQATGAGPFRKVPVNSKHLLELTKFWQEHHIVDVNKKVEVSNWEDKQVNRYTQAETMG